MSTLTEAAQAVAALAPQIADVIDGHDLDRVARGAGWRMQYNGRYSTDYLRMRYNGGGRECVPARHVSVSAIRTKLTKATSEIRRVTGDLTGEELSDSTSEFLNANGLQITSNYAVYATPLGGEARVAAWHWGAAYNAVVDGDLPAAETAIARVREALNALEGHQ